MSDLPKYLTVEEILKNVTPSTVAADVKREMEIERLTEIIQKPKTGKVLFSDSPEKLMVKLLAEMY